jgi:ribosomal protein uS17
MFAATTTRTQFTPNAVIAPRARAPRAPRAHPIVAAAQTLEGVVVAVSGSKSRTLRVDRKVPHPKYVKRMNVSKKFMFHDDAEACKVGDRVVIEACRPMSKTKKFTLKTVVYECDVNVDCAVA